MTLNAKRLVAWRSW